jgi:hypothetical protein
VVYRDGEEIGFIGSGSGCYTAISHHEIPAGGSLEWNWEVRAAVILRAYPDGRDPDVALAEPGEYLFRVEPRVFRIDGADERLPQLEQRIVVQ